MHSTNLAKIAWTFYILLTATLVILYKCEICGHDLASTIWVAYMLGTWEAYDIAMW